MVKKRYKAANGDDFARGAVKIILAALSILAYNPVQGAATSAANSILSGYTANVQKDAVIPISVQTKDTSGAWQSSGGDILTLVVEQRCTWTDQVYCALDPDQDNVAGLPISVLMTDHGDGTYGADYQVTAPGSVSLSVTIAAGDAGIVGQYWSNTDRSGDPDVTQSDSNIDFSWGGGPTSPLSQEDLTSMKWSGYIQPPTTETYQIFLTSDDGSTLTMNGQTLTAPVYYTESQSYSLTANTMYPFELTFAEWSGDAYVYLEWETSIISRQKIPTTAFFKDGKVGGTVYPVEVQTSVPAMSAVIDGPTNIIVGDTYTVTMQSKDAYSNDLAWNDDTYTLVLTGSTWIHTAVATHVSSGLYSAFVVPLVAEAHTVTINLTNAYTATDSTLDTHISGQGYTVTVHPVPVDPASSSITSSFPDQFSDTVIMVKAKLVDINGIQKTSGEDQVHMKVQQACDSLDNMCCGDTATVSDNVPGLPIDTPMTIGSDGEYFGTFTIIGGRGTVFVSAEVEGVGGILGSYWPNSSPSGDAEICQTDPQINFDWGTGNMTPLSTTRGSVVWTGYISPPITEEFSFSFVKDAQVTIDLNGHSTWNSPPNSIVMQRGVLYPLTITLQEMGNGKSGLELSWSSPSITAPQHVPNSAYVSQQRVGGAVHALEIIPTSVPAQSAVISWPTEVFAGETYTVTMQSRNGAGADHDLDNDTYTVVFTSGAETLTTVVTVDDVNNGGLYSADMLPTIAAPATAPAIVTINQTNDYTAQDATISTWISGSGYSVIVFPGEVDPTQCTYNTEVVGVEQVAGTSFDIIVQYVDFWGNVHYLTMGDVSTGWETTIVEATYDNHDEWLSLIGVPDDPNWPSIYSEQVATDDYNGKTTSQMTIERAGEFVLSVRVNNVDIEDPPNLTLLRVKPSSFHGPYSALHDVELEIYAGFFYDFYVQGRDEFKNNVRDTLSDALGTDFTVHYVNQDNTDIVVEATMVDDQVYPGVYYVSVELSKTLESAQYDLEIMMGGVPVDEKPTIDIRPCSNFIALERELVAPSDNIVTLDPLDYKIFEELQTIELPLVGIYCEHEATVLLKSAKRITQSGQTTVLTEDELATYGITLQPLGRTMQVYTETNVQEDATFELELSLTVVEELDWTNTALVQVNIFALPYVYEHVVVDYDAIGEGVPELDPDSVTDKTLQMTMDEDETYFLTPVILDCSLEWSKVLPDIVGESDENKFDVSVTLDQASKFLTYSPGTREFKLEASTEQKHRQQFYSVTINIGGSDGSVAQYSLKVSFRCDQDDRASEKGDFTGIFEFEYRYDESPPTPYIDSINSFGEVIIRFNQTMAPKASLRETEMGRGGRRRLPDVDSLEVAGKASQTFQNFSRVHNNSFTMEGVTFPSVKVTITPADEDSQCAKMLDFVWECVDFKIDELIFKLTFKNPECISSQGAPGDLLTITLYDQRLFEDSSGKLIWPETRLEKRLIRQLDPSGTEKETLEAIASSASTAIVTTSLINVILNFLLQGSLSTLVSALRNLQIIVHIMLIQIFLVAHAEIFLRSLQKLIAFEIYDITDLAKTLFGSEASDPLDIQFESVGYETSDAIINSGVISIVIFTAPFFLLVSYLASKFCCWIRVKGCFKRQLEQTLFNRVIIFVDGSFLIMGVCCTVNIYQVKTGVASKNVSYYFSICAIFAYIPYFLTLLGYLFYKFADLGSERLMNRVGNFYQNLDLNGAGRTAFVYTFFEYARRTAICFVITFGRESVTIQLLFIQFLSVFILMFVGIVKPFNQTRGNGIEIWNEYTILLIYCHCLTQTDFVEDIKGRLVMGWSLIGLISLNILINFGSMIASDLHKFFHRIKLYVMKKKWVKAMQIEQERRAKINVYRKNILDGLAQDKPQPSPSPKQSSFEVESPIKLLPVVTKEAPSQIVAEPKEAAVRKIELKMKKTKTIEKVEKKPDTNILNLKVRILSPSQLSKYKSIQEYEKEIKAIKAFREDKKEEEEDKEEQKVTMQYKIRDLGWDQNQLLVDSISQPPPKEMNTQEKIASMKRQLAMLDSISQPPPKEMSVHEKIESMKRQLAMPPAPQMRNKTILQPNKPPSFHYGASKYN